MNTKKLYVPLLIVFYCIMVFTSILFPLPQIPLHPSIFLVPSFFYIYEPIIQILVLIYWMVVIMGVIPANYIVEKIADKVGIKTYIDSELIAEPITIIYIYIYIIIQIFGAIIVMMIYSLAFFIFFDISILSISYMLSSYISYILLNLNLLTFHYVIMMILIYFNSIFWLTFIGVHMYFVKWIGSQVFKTL